jgi:cyclic-di-GMP-binding protein
MNLKLSLPPQEGHVAVEIRPAETDRWLSNLPVLNTAETSHQIFTALSGLNRRLLDDKTRLKLLELYRGPVRAVCQEQRKLYVGAPLPLPDKTKLVSQRVRQFQEEMAYGYKRVVMTHAAKDRLTTGEKTELALVVQRAIGCLTEVLAKSYELYAPSPAGTWREIHHLYRLAEIEGITEAPVPDRLNEAVAHSSVSHAYKQALLLDFADPYHLPARMLEKIQRYLDVHAPLAELTPVTEALRRDCQFLVNLDNDRAGVMNIQHTPITTEAQYRLLTTVELARTIHRQLHALQAGQQPEVTGLDKDFFRQQGIEMLMRLITSWGVNPKRLFPRTGSTAVRFEVATGIEAIRFHVNGGLEFEPSTNEVGPQPRRTAISGGALPAHAAGDTGGRYTMAVWDVLDESAGGFSLGKSKIHGEQVRVGDLIAVRLAGEAVAWSIAMVRWARATAADGIEFGAQRIAPGAAAVGVMPLAPAADRPLPALLLPEVKPLRQARTLVTPRGMYKPGGRLFLDDGYRSHPIQAGKLVNVTGSFEQFQFDFVEAP